MKKTKITKIERMLISAIISLTIAAPLITIAIISQGFAYTRLITHLDNEIEEVNQSSRELEVKKQGKLSYSEIQEYAARDNLLSNSDSYVTI